MDGEYGPVASVVDKVPGTFRKSYIRHTEQGAESKYDGGPQPSTTHTQKKTRLPLKTSPKNPVLPLHFIHTSRCRPHQVPFSTLRYNGRTLHNLTSLTRLKPSHVSTCSAMPLRSHLPFTSLFFLSAWHLIPGRFSVVVP